MTATNPAAQPAASQQAVVEAALVLLERMGLTPADLAAVPQDRLPVPTFAEYVPVVSAAVSAGTRRAYGSYWNRVLDQWGDRRLDEPTPSEIRQLIAILTPAGYAKLVESGPAHGATVRTLITDFSPGELQQLRAAAERIVARIQAAGSK